MKTAKERKNPKFRLDLFLILSLAALILTFMGYMASHSIEDIVKTGGESKIVISDSKTENSAYIDSKDNSQAAQVSAESGVESNAH